MRRLLLPLTLGWIALGALAAASGHDLIEATRTYEYARPMVTVARQENGFTVLRGGGILLRPHAALTSAQWWSSTPTLALAIAVIALLVWVALAALRHGVYAPRTDRLLQISYLTALVGGPLVVLVSAYAPRWADGDWTGTTLWSEAVIWIVVGGGLLAVRELLNRAGTMQTELDGVV